MQPKISTAKNGPFVLENFQTLTESTGSVVMLADPVTALCRCGKSLNKPFCDGTHGHIHFDDAKNPERTPRQVDTYQSRSFHVDGITLTIHDDRGICSHAGYCTELCPEVFDGSHEPWINPDGAKLEKIIETIRKCPSGALSYSINDVHSESYFETPAIELIENGQYRLHGNIVFGDDDQPTVAEHYTLCRCGKSQNKPFCDGKHWDKKFQDAGLVTEPFYVRHPETYSDELPYDNKLTAIQHLMRTGTSSATAMRTLTTFPDFKTLVFKCAQLDPFPLEARTAVQLQTTIGKKAKRPLVLDLPFFVSHMSFGAISQEAHVTLATGAASVGTAMCSGEGGMLPEARQAAKYYIYEQGTAAFTYDEVAFAAADAIELKIGQGVKPGVGGHLPAHKVTAEIAAIRHLQPGEASFAPARLAGVDSPNDLITRVATLRELTAGKPIGIKLATAHLEADLAIALQAQPDFITIDCRGGGTGSTVNVIKDNSGIPPIFAIPRARKFLNEHGGNDITLIATGGFRDASDIAKGIALGADAIALATASLIAIGCQQTRICHKGTCPTGIATQDPTLRKLLLHDKSVQSFINFYQGTAQELQLLARANGYSDIHDFKLEDLMTTSSEVSNHTQIEHV